MTRATRSKAGCPAPGHEARLVQIDSATEASMSATGTTKATNGRRLSLNLFIYPGGHHEAGWRFPGSAPDRLNDVSYYQELARKAEAAKFDAVFFADGPALPDHVRYAVRFRFEPLTLLTALAAATSRIGLIGTASTTYFEPYNLARLYASLDHISGGRAGWNIVTTSVPTAGANFGLSENPSHADRYARAGEFLEVVTKLWDSWEDDALVVDPVSGLLADDSKIHPIEHIGRHFRVKGALNTPRSPQGRPVYVQAGASDDGRSFAARYAEAIFTAHRRWTARRPSMPTSRRAPPRSAAAPSMSASCRGSAPISVPPKPRRRRCTRSSTH
ncbi:hypothetical protein AZL_a00730 (plasmid) [Azospirillum sp. B510]|nr:hypothetical protein AZL_a00730 [Azospirillum sp. B510]